jgi:hypothetical protein
VRTVTHGFGKAPGRTFKSKTGVPLRSEPILAGMTLSAIGRKGNIFPKACDGDLAALLTALALLHSLTLLVTEIGQKGL